MEGKANYLSDGRISEAGADREDAVNAVEAVYSDVHRNDLHRLVQRKEIRPYHAPPVRLRFIELWLEFAERIRKEDPDPAMIVEDAKLQHLFQQLPLELGRLEHAAGRGDSGRPYLRLGIPGQADHPLSAPDARELGEPVLSLVVAGHASGRHQGVGGRPQNGRESCGLPVRDCGWPRWPGGSARSRPADRAWETVESRSRSRSR